MFKEQVEIIEVGDKSVEQKARNILDFTESFVNSFQFVLASGHIEIKFTQPLGVKWEDGEEERIIEDCIGVVGGISAPDPEGRLVDREIFIKIFTYDSDYENAILCPLGYIAKFRSCGRMPIHNN